MDTFEKLKHKRTAIRTLTTKLINKCEKLFTEVDVDPINLIDSLEQLKAKGESLKELDKQIQEVIEDPTEFDNEIVTCETYYEKIISMESRIKLYYQTTDKGSATNVTQNNGNKIVGDMENNLGIQTVNKEHRIRLPKLSINSFNGDSSKFLSFWSQYENAIHNNDELSTVDKFNYLQSLVSGAAASAISGFSLTSDNYTEAISLLKQRFGRKDLVINAHMSKLLNLEPVKTMSNTLALRKLYDNIEIQIRNLNSLEVTSGTYGTLLTPILLKLLPNELSLEFNRKRKSQENFDVKELIEFLRQEIECREAMNQIQDRHHQDQLSTQYNQRRIPKNAVSTAAALATGSENFVNYQTKQCERKISCIFCGSLHNVSDCKAVQTLTLEQRKQAVMKKGACFRCLKLNHVASQCHSKVKCSNCAKNHHFLLCLQTNKPASHSENKDEKSFHTQDETLANVTITPHVLLQTLFVTISNGSKKMNVRAIIDSASQRSYILQSTARNLGYQSLRKENLRHSLFGGTSTDVYPHNVYRAYLSALSGSYRCNLEVLGQEKICETMPPVAQGIWMEELLQHNINLSDHCKGPIEILIGADVAGKLMTGGYKRLPSGLAAIETKLGWTVMGRSGKRSSDNNANLTVTSMLARDVHLTDLWDLDALGITDPAEKLTKGEVEEAAMEYFLRTIKRTSDGRYEVSLPWLEGHQPLTSNRMMAERRLKHTVKDLQSKNLLKDYEKELKQWQTEGIIESLDPLEIDETACFYLPHRAVVKEHSTTKIRPVFDASARLKNCPSLNDCIEKGPNLVELIPSILTRFRLGKFGVIADIRKAFLQISINEKDRNYLRFLWFENGDPEDLKIYRHTRVVFGVNASPFLLGATISHHLEQVSGRLWGVAQKLKNSWYVDNCVTSLDTEEEMENFINQSKEIMSSAKFDLRGWKHNEVRTDDLENLHDYTKDNINEKTSGESVSVLGMQWNTLEDTLCCTTKDDSLIFNVVTKRSILSAANQLFDPLGILSPVTLILKTLIQDCWKAKLSWDAELPVEIAKKFMKWKQNINKVKDLKIPRRLLPKSPHEIKLSYHIFCDASQLAYATCIYLRSEDVTGVTCHLIQARSRIAPMKTVTVSRLELLACTIGVRLMKTIKQDLPFQNVPSFYWTDSMNALHWIKNGDHWGVFVMNRVQEIRKYSNIEEWNHVPGTVNPADIPSRGCSLETLASRSWLEGPLWLNQDRGRWPSNDIFPDKDVIDSEKRKTIISTLTASEEKFSYYTQISSFEKIVRITAWVLRFVNNSKVPKLARASGDLNVVELKKAEKTIWKIVQKDAFTSIEDERLRRLCPFIDSSGIIRIRTRLLMRQDLENFKSPIVLPSDHIVVLNLIRHKHKMLSHCGIQTLMSVLRENFWILKSRKTIRKVLNSCVICKRFEARHPEVQTGPLPEDRIRDSAVFEITGIDLAGPLFLKDGTKAWIVLFTCAVYRAVHLELVSSLTTDKFLLSLRRFISRRGRPSIIYSDNGKNFVGANLALKKIDWERVIREMSVSRIEWKFIPPASPWWGGFWERMIGLMKTILRKVLGRASLRYEELSTILCDCENVLNSRPITYCSEDLELEPLTPAIFLRDIKESGVPDLDRVDIESLNKRRLYRIKICEDLRKRFRSEYLGQLRSYRSKTKNQHQFAIGEIVLIESKAKRSMWPLGKVIHLFPGKDGVVRLVKLRTKLGDCLRPIQKLYALEVTSPMDDEFRSTVTAHDDSIHRTMHEDLNVAPEKAKSDIKNFTEFDDIGNPPASSTTSRHGRLIRAPSRLDL